MLTTIAILWLSPYISDDRANNYATIIQKHSDDKEIDPLLVVAIMFKESSFRPSRVSNGNYGLMQVRISKTVNRSFVGRENLMLDPDQNIKSGVELMAYWKWYHRVKCKNNNHRWWSHYQWGNIVRNGGSGERVGDVYRLLKRKFGYYVERSFVREDSGNGASVWRR